MNEEQTLGQRVRHIAERALYVTSIAAIAGLGLMMPKAHYDDLTRNLQRKGTAIYERALVIQERTRKYWATERVMGLADENGNSRLDDAEAIGVLRRMGFTMDTVVTDYMEQSSSKQLEAIADDYEAARNE